MTESTRKIGDLTRYQFSNLLAFLVVLILFSYAGATPGWDGDCDLKVTGFDKQAGGVAPYKLDGLYLYCGASSPIPGQVHDNYCLNDGDEVINEQARIKCCPPSHRQSIDLILP